MQADASQYGDELRAVALRMEAFEAAESVENTGAGARREGSNFEGLVEQLWGAFHDYAVVSGAESYGVTFGGRSYTELVVDSRSVVIPGMHGRPQLFRRYERWLEVSFRMDDLVGRVSKEIDVVRKCAPRSGRFSGDSYPDMYRGLTTRFDGTVVLVDSGELHEKILLEYKTAKSSRGRQIDGNAHERLSFQMMQYLEVAKWYDACSLAVMANGAFVHYRNKYHVSFHLHAERLRQFPWFLMEYACTADQYLRFLGSIHAFLFEGRSRR